EKVIGFADADDERTTLPCADDTSRLSRGDHRDRERAVKFSDRHPNGSEQIAVSRAVPMRMNQMRDDLGIGWRAKRIALRLQPLAQRFVVFDDAVVDDGDFVARQ